MAPTLDLTSLVKAVAALGSGLKVYDQRLGEGAPAEERELLRAGVIQSFEFTYELCWKHMKRWLEMNVSPEAADGAPRRELFRLCAENKLISDVNKWMEFHQARSITAHTYNENMAAEVLAAARQFLPYARDGLKELQQRS